MAQVQSALEGLSSIGQGNVYVAGPATATAGSFLLVFRNNLGGQSLPQITANNVNLAGTTPAVSSTLLQLGGGDNTQNITLSSATSGTFTLTVNNQTTAPLAFNATTAQVQAALQALPGVGANNVVISGTAGASYNVAFVGDLAFHGVPQITATSSLNAGATITSTTTSPGVFLGATAQQSLIVTNATSGTFILNFDNLPTVAIPFNADGNTIQNDLIAADPSLAGNIVVSGPTGSATTAGGPFTVTFLNGLANRDEHLGFINTLLFSNTQSLVEVTNLTVGGLGEAIQGPAVTNTSTVNFSQPRSRWSSVRTRVPW